MTHVPGAAGAPGLPYRRDIDGMRALAVIAVIVFHAFPGLCPAGFAGVDVFFVLSGYLISGLILNALARGDFSFAGFYARRIRRIFPALLVVLAVSLASGWYLLAPGEWHKLAMGALRGLTFASNIGRAPAGGYFTLGLPTDVFLHLWSLGIEEQFYLAWPLALFGLWKAAGNGRHFRVATAGILLAAALSFAFDLHALPVDTDLAFFNPLSRMWELLAGAALSAVTLRYGQAERRVAVELLSGAGVLLIVLTLMLLDEGRPAPGWWSLLPVGGALLLVAAGSQAWFNRRVLSSRPLTAIGLISYPLYLWHWPLVVFPWMILDSGLAISPQRHMAVTAVMMALALVLAKVTYRFVETPMRFSSKLCALSAPDCCLPARF